VGHGEAARVLCGVEGVTLGEPTQIRSLEIQMSRLLAGLLLAAVAIPGPILAASRGVNPIKLFDTDNDGTLDRMEVRKAAISLFEKLDPDHDGTLDVRELRGRLSAKEIEAADPDRDGTLTINEYLAVVTQRFDAADPDKDGTLDARELRSPAGRALLRLLK